MTLCTDFYKSKHNSKVKSSLLINKVINQQLPYLLVFQRIPKRSHQ